MGNKTKYLTIFFILSLCVFATTIFVNKDNCDFETMDNNLDF